MSLWRRGSPLKFSPFLILFVLFYYIWAHASSYLNVPVHAPVPADPPKATLFNHLYTETNTLRPKRPHRLGRPPPPYPTPAPKITIIALWSSKGGARPAYLPNFFASVAANPSVDLLFIKFDKHGKGTDCREMLSDNIPNVREVCLSVEEYWTLHADFLCERWGCSRAQRKLVEDKLWERAGGDFVNSYFRPFRAAVFKKWVNPNTKIWGWCDLDTMLGNFERLFPWDVAEDYDMLVPGASINGDEVLLYLPGHLMFFRHAKHVVDEFMTLPNLLSPEAYLKDPWIGHDAEESDYSHFAFTNPRLTFLWFEAMVSTQFHISSPGTGMYNIHNEWWWDFWTPAPFPSVTESRSLMAALIRDYEKSWTKNPTFSDKGSEYEVQTREGEYPAFLWFSKSLAVDFVTDPDKFQGQLGARYVMRRVPGGPVVDRQEPDHPLIFRPADPNADQFNRHNRPYLKELLYNHYQTEKYRQWWSLPERAIRPNELLLIDKDIGAHVWNSEGHLLFDSTVAQ